MVRVPRVGGREVRLDVVEHRGEVDPCQAVSPPAVENARTSSISVGHPPGAAHRAPQHPADARRVDAVVEQVDHRLEREHDGAERRLQVVAHPAGELREPLVGGGQLPAAERELEDVDDAVGQRP